MAKKPSCFDVIPQFGRKIQTKADYHLYSIQSETGIKGAVTNFNSRGMAGPTVLGLLLENS